MIYSVNFGNFSLVILKPEAARQVPLFLVSSFPEDGLFQNFVSIGLHSQKKMLNHPTRLNFCQRHTFLVTSVADPECSSWIPDSYFLSFPNTGSKNSNKRGGGKNLSSYLFSSLKFTKLKILLFLNR